LLGLPSRGTGDNGVWTKMERLGLYSSFNRFFRGATEWCQRKMV
jgi:hypothetical protein